MLAGILVDMDPPVVLEYHEHDSLLEHRETEQLTEEERKQAWANFKMDKEKKMNNIGKPFFDFCSINHVIKHLIHSILPCLPTRMVNARSFVF